MSKPPTKKKILAQLKLGESRAKALTVVGIKVLISDAMTKPTETVTTSLPWMLGHGEWVVKVEGKSGGWCCSMLTPMEYKYRGWEIFWDTYNEGWSARHPNGNAVPPCETPDKARALVDAVMAERQVAA